MKKYYFITISDSLGSKYFFFKPRVKRNAIIIGVVVSLLVITSVTTSLFQHGSINKLTAIKTQLSEDLVKYDRENSQLNLTILEHQRLVDEISLELVNIEQFSGVDTGDQRFSLEERIKIIGQFYNAKEEEYSVIGSRVEQIEDTIGLDEHSAVTNEMDLAARVELASLTASQERILHDSIPNGYPTKDLHVTSKFGKRKHPVTKVNSFHNGVDIRAKTGEKTFATADGFVSHADYSKLSGNRIVILHNFGFETRYSHLKEMHVEPGDVVHKGDLIGYSGNTGQSNGAHLHYEIRYLGKATNPHEFLNWEFGSNEIFTQVRGIKWPSLINLINKQITHQTLQLSLLDRTSRVE